MTAMDWLQWALGVLYVVQALGLATFIGVYMRSNWRSTDIGRNLMAFAVVLIAVSAVSAVYRLEPNIYVGWLIAAGHATFGVVVWQRVVMAYRYQRQDDAVSAVDRSARNARNDIADQADRNARNARNARNDAQDRAVHNAQEERHPDE